VKIKDRGQKTDKKMIRINLLTEKRKKKREVKKEANFLLKIGFITAGTLLVCIGITTFLRFNISSLKNEMESNQAVLADLQKKAIEVKRYEELNKEIAHRSSIIEALRKNQSIPVRILNDISLSLPNGVWLSALNYKQEVSDIEGYAFGNANIVNYVENLKRLGSLKDVYLVESKESEFEKTRVYKFKISFRINPIERF
jgi:type IV pilus assembly protein PilN